MKSSRYIPKNLSLYKNIFYENVRWGDTDGYNHVNNVSISRYFESARVNIIRDLENSVDNWKYEKLNETKKISGYIKEQLKNYDFS